MPIETNSPSGSYGRKMVTLLRRRLDSSCCLEGNDDAIHLPLASSQSCIITIDVGRQLRSDSSSELTEMHHHYFNDCEMTLPRKSLDFFLPVK
jgi:hypothetical protein